MITLRYAKFFAEIVFWWKISSQTILFLFSTCLSICLFIYLEVFYLSVMSVYLGSCPTVPIYSLFLRQYTEELPMPALFFVCLFLFLGNLWLLCVSIYLVLCLRLVIFCVISGDFSLFLYLCLSYKLLFVPPSFLPPSLPPSILSMIYCSSDTQSLPLSEKLCIRPFPFRELAHPSKSLFSTNCHRRISKKEKKVRI